MARLVPKHCIVHSIELDGKGRAEIRYRCVRDGQMERGQHTYEKPGGVTGNYPSRTVKASSVSFRGMTVSGPARMGFVLSPASAVCHKQGREIRCKLQGDTSTLPSLAGLYVGISGKGREVFRSKKTPTDSSHGKKYGAAIGPFRTRRGAEIMAKYGANNPHIRSVADAERMAKRGR
jgi:hypothetical protein